MEQHFVEFYSPGTVVSEVSERPIDEWDVQKAVDMAVAIKERHGAVPYGFRFTTRARNDDELDGREVKRSGIYYLGGKVETREEVEARNGPSEAILRSNMRARGIDKIIVNNNSWRFTTGLNDGDTVLDVDFAALSRAGETDNG